MTIKTLCRDLGMFLELTEVLAREIKQNERKKIFFFFFGLKKSEEIATLPLWGVKNTLSHDYKNIVP